MMMRVMLFLPMEKTTMNSHARMLVSPPKVQLLLAGADRSKYQTPAKLPENVGVSLQ